MSDNVGTTRDDVGTKVAVVCRNRAASCRLHAHLRTTLASTAGVAVVGVLSYGREALASVPVLRPDVLLLEAAAGDSIPIDLVRRLVTCGQPYAPAVLLVAERADDGMMEVLWRGARGLLLAGPCGDLLVQAIHLVAAGYLVVPRSMRSSVLRNWESCTRPAHIREAIVGTLSEREVEVLKLVAGGHTNAEVSARLRLSESTVKSHIQRILGKLGLRNRVALAILAHDVGLI